MFLFSSFTKYYYSAKVTKVYDGDTITCDVDLGFDINMSNQKIRLYGIDAPELRGPKRTFGIVSRDSLRKWILGKDIELQTIQDKKGKYGRYLGIIYIEGENINDKLVSLNLAERANY